MTTRRGFLKMLGFGSAAVVAAPVVAKAVEKAAPKTLTEALDVCEPGGIVVLPPSHEEGYDPAYLSRSWKLDPPKSKAQKFGVKVWRQPRTYKDMVIEGDLHVYSGDTVMGCRIKGKVIIDPGATNLTLVNNWSGQVVDGREEMDKFIALLNNVHDGN